MLFKFCTSKNCSVFLIVKHFMTGILNSLITWLGPPKIPFLSSSNHLPPCLPNLPLPSPKYSIMLGQVGTHSPSCRPTPTHSHHLINRLTDSPSSKATVIFTSTEQNRQPRGPAHSSEAVTVGNSPYHPDFSPTQSKPMSDISPLLLQHNCKIQPILGDSNCFSFPVLLLFPDGATTFASEKRDAGIYQQP